MTLTADRFTTALAEALAGFTSWATMNAPDLPDNQIDSVQVQLCRWQRANFGDVSPTNKIDVHMSLGVIEEFGELVNAKTIWGKSGKLDAVGDICVYIGQLCIGNRMAVRPIIELAEELAIDWANDVEANEHDVEIPDPTVIAGMLAHVALKRDQKIRGYDNDDQWQTELVTVLAKILAWSKLDTEMLWMDRPEGFPEEEPGSPTSLNTDNLLARTYIDVAQKVVLKRNWTASRLDGQTPVP